MARDAVYGGIVVRDCAARSGDVWGGGGDVGGRGVGGVLFAGAEGDGGGSDGGVEARVDGKRRKEFGWSGLNVAWAP